MLLSIQNEREWATFCDQVLGMPDLARDERFSNNVRRVANVAELEALIAPLFLAIDRETAMRKLQDARIACGRLSTMDEMQHHPQVRHIEVSTSTGPVAMMARGVRFSNDVDVQRPAVVPSLGQQTGALRREFATGAKRKRA